MGQKARDRRTHVPPPLLTSRELKYAIYRACTRKKPLGQRAAKLRAADKTAEHGVLILAYCCPFAKDGGHWHIGRPMSEERLQDMALAVRAYQQAVASGR